LEKPTRFGSRFPFGMKIAVVGCGAVGSFYGGKLAHAGHEVYFQLRSDYETVRRKGVFIRSPQGDFRVHPKCADAPEQIGVCDLVLIALKTTANEQFAKLLPPLVNKDTALLTLQYGLGNEEQLASLFPLEQIMGGLCFVCLNRLQPGLIHHIEHGLVVLGEFQRFPEPRTHDIASMFRQAGVPCKVTDNLQRAHWEKLAWNIPFNGLGVAAAAGYEALTTQSASVDKLIPVGQCLTTDRLLGEVKWERLVRELMQEVIETARSLQLNLPDNLVEKQIERTRSMGAYKASTLIDFERGQPLELKSLFLAPLNRAKDAGVSVPQLERLCQVLNKLNNRVLGSQATN
jgi:2-dehydropantoate 2-reductase